MTKNMKFIAPLTLVAFATLASCGGKAQVKSIKLNRTTYSNEINKLADALSVIELAGVNQAEYNLAISDSNRSYIKSIDHYNLFEKGTVTSNLGFNLSGSVKVYAEDINPIELDGVGIGALDSYTTSWNLKEGYVKFSGSKDGASYVIKENDDYWRYIDYPIDGKKYKVNITDYIDTYFNGRLENFIMVESAANSGIFFEYKKQNIPFFGAGLDMSGFGVGAKFETQETPEVKNDDSPITYVNVLAPGDILAFDLSGILGGKFQGTVATAIDVVVTLLDYVVDVLKLDGLSVTHNYTKNDYNSACSLELGLGLDLSYIEDIVNTIKPFLPWIIPDGSDFNPDFDFDLAVNGNVGLDYFLSFENNFVRQQEIALEAKDLNLMLNTYEGYVPFMYQNMMVDIKDADFEIIMNENVEKDKCEMDTFNKDEYKEFKIE